MLRKALSADLPVVLVVNKLDRPDARTAEVVHEVEDLFLDIDAEEHQLDFPIVYASARSGWATMDREQPGSDLTPLLQTLVEHIPAPIHEPDHPTQAWVTNLDASPYVGRLALCRMQHGILKKGQPVAWCRADGTVQNAKLGELYVTEGLERVEADQVGPGEIIALSGLPEVTIGETIADPADPRPLPVIAVDEPSLSVEMGVNTSPLAGKDGKKLTARMIEGRLDTELVGNVSLRVLPTERPDAWEVQGRGELQLAVLIETMRREGFELTVGRPEVVTREIGGKLHEPVERLVIDVPEEHLGAVTQLVAQRRGRMLEMVNHGSGWVRLDHIVPARGLIGFRTEFLTETRGTGIYHHTFEGWEPWAGELRTRTTGSLVSDRSGAVTGYAIAALQERSTLFVAPGTQTYAGMIVGENPRAEDMDVNICREKKQTNVRAAAADDTVRLTPPVVFNLEQALEWVAGDECVEVTPEHLRLRKVTMDAGVRARTRKAEKQART